MAREIWMTLGIGLGLALSACSGAGGADSGALEHESETLDSAGGSQTVLDGAAEDSEIGSAAQPLVRGGGSGGGLGYSCSGLVCTCTGDEDCNDMFGDGVCGDVASCDTTNPLQPICKCSILRVSQPSKTVAVKAGTLTAARQ